MELTWLWRLVGLDFQKKLFRMAAPKQRVIESPLFLDYLSIRLAGSRKPAPVNLQNRSSEEINGAAEYSVRTGNIAREIMRDNGVPLDGTILELGPGWDFGGALLLGEDSKKLIVADRFLARWQPTFHPLVYREMQRMLARPSRLLDEVVRDGGYDGIIETAEEPAYDLRSIPDNSVDLVYSNAVLEHVHPLDKAAVELFRLTKPGGHGAHQIDLRYHRNFDLPLEHLLFAPDEFAHLLEITNCEVGCQTRATEAVEIFARAGFEVTKTDANMTAPDSYMRDFLPRLRRSDMSTYRHWEEEELAKLSARLFLRKPV
jgi:SAM-dependent methyltransferase